jgi:hypothetical protein
VTDGRATPVTRATAAYERSGVPVHHGCGSRHPPAQHRIDERRHYLAKEK